MTGRLTQRQTSIEHHCSGASDQQREINCNQHNSRSAFAGPLSGAGPRGNKGLRSAGKRSSRETGAEVHLSVSADGTGSGRRSNSPRNREAATLVPDRGGRPADNARDHVRGPLDLRSPDQEVASRGCPERYTNGPDTRQRPAEIMAFRIRQKAAINPRQI